MELAACKITVSKQSAPQYRAVKYRIEWNYRTWINEAKELALSTGRPLKAEFIHLVSQDDVTLGAEAEEEALGFRAANLHPDIYMDEILRSIRIMHQILPAICEKLEIKDIDLDVSDLYNY